jgi:hypothetical protein
MEVALWCQKPSTAARYALNTGNTKPPADFYETILKI